MDKAISVRTITPGTDRDRAPGGLGHVDSGRYSVAKNRIRDAWTVTANTTQRSSIRSQRCFVN